MKPPPSVGQMCLEITYRLGLTQTLLSNFIIHLGDWKKRHIDRCHHVIKMSESKTLDSIFSYLYFLLPMIWLWLFFIPLNICCTVEATLSYFTLLSHKTHHSAYHLTAVSLKFWLTLYDTEIVTNVYATKSQPVSLPG